MRELEVVVKEIDYNDYRIGLTNGEDTVFIFKTKSETDAGIVKTAWKLVLRQQCNISGLMSPGG